MGIIYVNELVLRLCAALFKGNRHPQTLPILSNVHIYNKMLLLWMVGIEIVLAYDP